MFDLRLHNFFNLDDTQGNHHNGFIQSIDLTSYVDLTILNEITLYILDAFILNEIGNLKTMSRWNCFMRWDKENKKWIINADFYESAKQAIYVYLTRSQRFFELLSTDFRSLNATETEQIIYGAKEEQKDYDKVIVNVERDNDSIQWGADLTTRVFGELQKQTEYGNTQSQTMYGSTEKQTEYGNTEKQTEYGNTEKTIGYGETRENKKYGQVEKEIYSDDKHNELKHGNTSETFITGQQTNSSDVTNQTHPFDLNTFLDDTASATSTTNGQRQDTKTAISYTDETDATHYTDKDTTKEHTDIFSTLAHTDTETNAVHTDTETHATHTDTETHATHTDTETTTTHTDTETENAHTDTETTATHTDTETENAHTDTETRSNRTDVNIYGDITNTTDERTDVTTIKTHTDTKTRTKVILISPEKYYEIMKELMSYNVYDIVLSAIKDCFTIRAF